MGKRIKRKKRGWMGLLGGWWKATMRSNTTTHRTSLLCLGSWMSCKAVWLERNLWIM
jgi:hypothetical protein